jgi:flagellin-like hook-associated protein FlgL
MAFDISLTAGMRADLISLQGTAQLLNRTQGRLSSGKQVNSAVDDPSKYFAAQDHINHASDLSARKSDMGEAIQSVKAANQGITGITGLINQAQGLINSAQSANTTTRASLAAQFNVLRTQMTQLASDSGYNGKNFLQGDSLNVLFNESGSSKLTVTGFQGDASGLGITTAAHATGTAYNTGQVLNSANVASATTVAVRHSGVLVKSFVSVTQTMTHTAEAAAGSTSAGSISGKSITLAHTGVAANVRVYETIAYTKTAAISSAKATAAAIAAKSAVFTKAVSAMPTSISLHADKTSGYTAETVAGSGSAASISGAVVNLQNLGEASSVTVYEQLAYTAVAAFSAGAVTADAAGSSTFTVTATMMATPANITVKVGGSAIASADFSSSFNTGTGVLTITIKAAQAGAATVTFDYNHKLASTTDYTLSTGTTTTAGSLTFAHDLTGAVKVNYTATKRDQALATSDYTASFNTGTSQVSIKLRTAQTNAVTVAFNYDKTLTNNTDYTLSVGGTRSAGTITFKDDFSGAIKVTYKAKVAVATGRFTVSAGSAATAGKLTFAAQVTGNVQVTYSVNTTLWGSNGAIQTDMDNLNNAITALRTQAASMAANLSVITTRQDWSAGMISNLQTGSDNLTLADMNEEGANMLALQTRQQLGIQALSLASQANQSIMRLFG